MHVEEIAYCVQNVCTMRAWRLFTDALESILTNSSERKGSVGCQRDYPHNHCSEQHFNTVEVMLSVKLLEQQNQKGMIVFFL